MNSNKKVIAIIGLPASGKTTLAEALMKLGEVEFILDDPQDMSDIEDAFSTDEPFAVTCPYLCIDESINKLEELVKQYDFELEFIYFENDAKQCKINAATRPTRKVDNLIVYLTKLYHIPEWASPRSVNYG